MSGITATHFWRQTEEGKDALKQLAGLLFNGAVKVQCTVLKGTTLLEIRKITSTISKEVREVRGLVPVHVEFVYTDNEKLHGSYHVPDAEQA